MVVPQYFIRFCPISFIFHTFCLMDKMLLEESKIFWREARTKTMQQHFFLPELPPSVRLVFEPLTYENGMQLFEIFENDTHPYVDERFKSQAEVADYVACMMEYARYSNTHAAFDWLIKLKATGAYVGVIHLHDLSNQMFGSANRKATMGYAIGEQFRRQGFVKESITHFSNFLFENSNKIKLLVYTDKENTASVALMQSLNWQQTDDKYVYSDTYTYFELWKKGYDSFVAQETKKRNDE